MVDDEWTKDFGECIPFPKELKDKAELLVLDVEVNLDEELNDD